jgi:hypothetical protein
VGPPSTFSRWWWTHEDLQLRHVPRVRHRRFHIGAGRSRTSSSGTSRGPAIDVFTLVVGAPGPSVPAPLTGPPSMFSRWWWAPRSSSFSTSQGPVVDVLMLVAGAPGAPAPVPPRGPPSMFSCWWWALPELQLRHLSGARRRRFHVGGGRSRTFSSGTSRGPAVDIFTLVVGVPGPSPPAPPGGSPSTFLRWCWALPDLQLRQLPRAHCRRFHVAGGRSQTFSSGTFRGPAVDIFTLVVVAPSTAE